jgi:hypothetical protein
MINCWIDSGKTIIAGSRGITDYSLVEEAVKESNFCIQEVVSGTARGVDKLGEEYATKNCIPLSKFPADWNKHGKGAGYIRNSQMADYADSLIALWDGKSKGTKHMIDDSKKKGLNVFVKIIG